MTILRARLDDLPAIDFQPTIIGLDVIETPPEKVTLMMAEFRAREAELARAHYHDADDMAAFAEVKVWPCTKRCADVAAAEADGVAV